jgi:hypothetical protein
MNSPSAPGIGISIFPENGADEIDLLHQADSAMYTAKRKNQMVSLAIDDFGTGCSCLGYLPKVPFDVLKIDRSSVKELGSRSETKAMVQSLVDMAHNLDMKVIVEGIETPEELTMIREFRRQPGPGVPPRKAHAGFGLALRRWQPTVVNIEAQNMSSWWRTARINSRWLKSSSVAPLRHSTGTSIACGWLAHWKRIVESLGQPLHRSRLAKL